jgi:hypothetical protein
MVACHFMIVPEEFEKDDAMREHKRSIHGVYCATVLRVQSESEECQTVTWQVLGMGELSEERSKSPQIRNP